MRLCVGWGQLAKSSVDNAKVLDVVLNVRLRESIEKGFEIIS